ncbi:hypothetical protein IU474_30905 [Nocardia otitidiscaviarum]|uniref:hypothetical protein n=1 Tax=Nocardia otitidiscaviarum TaxID=1823 RepID=UPI001892DAF2|nr:hypothetical protein [Nocardia otitidiscaviarum]MBF6241454.1 hypothetical protein [Nocardia otitidiscaviarum]
MDKAPTVVAIYDVGGQEPRRVAEFRLASDGTAVLTVTDPGGCLVAEQWHERGVKIYDPLSRVGPEQGARFLRALLQTPGMSYYRVVDESPTPPRPGP